jgi:uncharacterized circularly permuted ATP-grasp superfamily protein
MIKLSPSLNPGGWDEMFSKDGVRHSYRQVLHALEGLNLETLHKKQKSLRYLHESRNHFYGV